MRWTLWLILLVLLAIWHNVSGKTMDEGAEAVCFILGLSGITLFLDYLNKRKKK